MTQKQLDEMRETLRREGDSARAIIKDVLLQKERAEAKLAIAQRALESVAWGYTGGASAKTLGEIAGKALNELE